MKSLLGIFILILSVEVVTSACPDDGYEFPPGLNTPWPCFYFGNYSLSYADAEYVCESRSGHLLPVSNSFINIYVTQVAKATGQEPTFWIGVTNMIGGNWSNVDDGLIISFTSWASGQPNNISNFRFCVYMDDQALWYGQYCNETLPFLCGVREVGSQYSSGPLFSAKPHSVPSDKRKTSGVLSTKKSTPFGFKSSDCRSYVPFSFDVSKKLTPKQFKGMKDFIFHMFSPVVLSNNIKPASVSTYGERNHAIKKPESLIETVASVVGTNEQTADLDSDITKPLRFFVAEGENKRKDGIPVNALVFAGSDLKDTRVSEAQRYVNKLTANGNTVTVVLVDPTIDQTNYKKVQGLNIVVWSDPITLASNLKANLKCA